MTSAKMIISHEKEIVLNLCLYQKQTKENHTYFVANNNDRFGWAVFFTSLSYER